MYAPSTFELLGLPSNWYGAVEFQYPPHLRQGAYEEEGRCINTLKVRPRASHGGRRRPSPSATELERTSGAARKTLSSSGALGPTRLTVLAVRAGVLHSGSCARQLAEEPPVHMSGARAGGPGTCRGSAAGHAAQMRGVLLWPGNLRRGALAGVGAGWDRDGGQAGDGEPRLRRRDPDGGGRLGPASAAVEVGSLTGHERTPLVSLYLHSKMSQPEFQRVMCVRSEWGTGSPVLLTCLRVIG